MEVFAHMHTIAHVHACSLQVIIDFLHTAALRGEGAGVAAAAVAAASR